MLDIKSACLELLTAPTASTIVSALRKKKTGSLSGASPLSPPQVDAFRRNALRSTVREQTDILFHQQLLKDEFEFVHQPPAILLRVHHGDPFTALGQEKGGSQSLPAPPRLPPLLAGFGFSLPGYR